MSNYQVDRQRWSQLTTQEQMGNIGSEVGRSIKAWRTHDTERFDGALDRALDLFDATTVQLTSQRSPRAKEVLRARDQFLALFFGGTFQTDASKLEDYFMQYALAARSHR